VTGAAIALIAVGLLLWVAAAHMDKVAALENDRFIAVLLLIVFGIGCVVAGAMWLISMWIEGD
jgi:hypothetical protein